MCIQERIGNTAFWRGQQVEYVIASPRAPSCIGTLRGSVARSLRKVLAAAAPTA